MADGESDTNIKSIPNLEQTIDTDKLLSKQEQELIA
jgi:hypothetical protein